MGEFQHECRFGENKSCIWILQQERACKISAFRRFRGKRILAIGLSSQKDTIGDGISFPERIFYTCAIGRRPNTKRLQNLPMKPITSSRLLGCVMHSTYCVLNNDFR